MVVVITLCSEIKTWIAKESVRVLMNYKYLSLVVFSGKYGGLVLPSTDSRFCI